MTRRSLPLREQHLWNLAEQVMTPEQLQAFQLRFRDDFTTTDIARMLGVSRQAINARLDGARRRLEKALNEQEAA